MPKNIKLDSDGLKFYGDGDNKVTVNAPAALSSDTQLTLPSTSGTVALTSDVVGFANPMTTAGDLILGGASGTPARLAIGSNAQVLTSNGTTASWATPSASGLPVVVVKQTTETVTSSTTYQDDDELLFTMDAGKTYIVTFAGKSNNTTVDLKYRFSAPSDAVGSAVLNGAGTFAKADYFVSGLTTQVVTSVPTDVGVAAFVTVRSVTGGTFKVQWAQLASNATATGLIAGSFITYQVCA